MQKTRPKDIVSDTIEFSLGSPSPALALTSPAEVDHIIKLIFNQAKRQLHIRATRLEHPFFKSDDLSSSLTTLIKGDVQNKVRFLIDDTFHLFNSHLRLVQLARKFSSYIEIHKAAEDYCETSGFFIVADQIGYVHQSSNQTYPVRAEPYAPAQARSLEQQFGRDWGRSERIAELSTVGLAG